MTVAWNPIANLMLQSDTVCVKNSFVQPEPEADWTKMPLTDPLRPQPSQEYCARSGVKGKLIRRLIRRRTSAGWKHILRTGRRLVAPSLRRGTGVAHSQLFVSALRQNWLSKSNVSDGQ
jgi:hypothetical protein